jgi:hypothetical protein
MNMMWENMDWGYNLEGEKYAWGKGSTKVFWRSDRGNQKACIS